MIDIQKMKALAEAATKQHAEWVAAGEPWPVWNSYLMEMYGAANPAAVLELIAEIEYLQLEMSGVERAKQDLAEKLGCGDEPRWKWMLIGAADLTNERDQLKAENEALRKDAERYRWLRKNTSVILDRKTSYQAETGFIKFDTMPARSEMQTAIDAAISKEASHD